MTVHFAERGIHVTRLKASRTFEELMLDAVRVKSRDRATGYSNILLKLYLKSLKHGGRLQLDEDIPYTAQMIATITRQQIGTVERAL